MKTSLLSMQLDGYQWEDHYSLHQSPLSHLSMRFVPPLCLMTKSLINTLEAYLGTYVWSILMDILPDGMRTMISHGKRCLAVYPLALHAVITLFTHNQTPGVILTILITVRVRVMTMGVVTLRKMGEILLIMKMTILEKLPTINKVTIHPMTPPIVAAVSPATLHLKCLTAPVI